MNTICIVFWLASRQDCPQLDWCRESPKVFLKTSRPCGKDGKLANKQ